MRNAARPARGMNRQITAKELFEQLKNMVGVAPLKLQEDVWGMCMWDVLKGDRWMQRVWCFGNSARAEAPGTVGTAAASAGPGFAAGAFNGTGMGAECSSIGASAAQGLGASGPWQGRTDLPSRYTSALPLSLLEGVEFVSVSAGAAHAAAASSDPRGHVYVWGSNQWGQLGTGAGDAELVVQHLIQEQHTVASAVTLQELVPNLPDSLLRGIEAAEARAAKAALREQGDNRMLEEEEREALAAAALGTQQAARAARERRLVERPAVLKVYRLALGVRVVSIACGKGLCTALSAPLGLHVTCRHVVCQPACRLSTVVGCAVLARSRSRCLHVSMPSPALTPGPHVIAAHVLHVTHRHCAHTGSHC